MNVKDIDFLWNKNFSIFASEAYLRTIGTQYGWIGGFINDKLSFVLPYAIKSKLIFKSLVFTTDTIYYSFDIDVDQEKKFLNGVIQYFSNKKIDFIQQPSTNVVFNTYPDNSIFAPFGSYQLDLSLSEKLLWEGMNSKHRNVIRNAEKNTVRIDRGHNNKYIAYMLLKETMDRSEMSFPEKNSYEHFITTLGKHIEIFVAYKEDDPQGCAVIPNSEFCAYYLWGGSIEKPYLGSMNLLQWELIKYFKSIGVKKYDFVGARIKPEEGSKLEGIQRFKVRFGATMRTGFLWKHIYNPFKFKLYRFASKLKNGNNRSSQGDIIDQERKKLLNENCQSNI